MTEQPTALRLANSLAAHSLSRHGQTQAAAELRRLHAENDRLERERDEARRTVREAHEAGTRLTAQRDALLAVVNKLEYSSDGYIKRYPEESEVSAAIKQAEGENT